MAPAGLDDVSDRSGQPNINALAKRFRNRVPLSYRDGQRQLRVCPSGRAPKRRRSLVVEIEVCMSAMREFRPQPELWRVLDAVKNTAAEIKATEGRVLRPEGL